MKNQHITSLSDILSWFEAGDFPTAPQFQATFSSFYHKDENIPMNKVEGLGTQLAKYTLAETFQNHLGNQAAHENHLVKLDASNLKEQHIKKFKIILNTEGIEGISNEW